MSRSASNPTAPPPDIVTESSMEVESMNGGGTPNNNNNNQSSPGDDPLSTATRALDDADDDAADTSTSPVRSSNKRRSTGTAPAINKTYVQLVQEAIVDMKDRTGSSLPAIKGWLGNHYSDLAAHPQFARNINKAIKNTTDDS